LFIPSSPSLPTPLLPVTQESLDRKSLLLPGVQEDLIKAIAKRTTTPIVVVLINGGNLDVAWAVNSDRVSAILTAWYPGQVRCQLQYMYSFVFQVIACTVCHFFSFFFLFSLKAQPTRVNNGLLFLWV
jgi:phenylacetate-coenzyme A ligase PaaK-like adenylate-forming protein